MPGKPFIPRFSVVTANGGIYKAGFLTREGATEYAKKERRFNRLKAGYKIVRNKHKWL